MSDDGVTGRWRHDYDDYWAEAFREWAAEALADVDDERRRRRLEADDGYWPPIGSVREMDDDWRAVD